MKNEAVFSEVKSEIVTGRLSRQSKKTQNFFQLKKQIN